MPSTKSKTLAYPPRPRRFDNRYHWRVAEPLCVAGRLFANVYFKIRMSVVVVKRDDGTGELVVVSHAAAHGGETGRRASYLF